MGTVRPVDRKYTAMLRRSLDDVQHSKRERRAAALH